MNKLKIPFQNESAGAIFEECAKGFRDSVKVNLLLSYKSSVESSADDYLRYIPKDIESFPETSIHEDDRDLLISVYSRKFADKSYKTGRKYYDKILAASGGKCAICSVGVAETLDHYLPKTDYPLLCVYPANLVPECHSCNYNKGDFFHKHKSKMLIHPYFDDFSKIEWLNVKLSFASFISIEYYNSYTIDSVISSRLSETVEKYKLAAIFSIQANSLISNSTAHWKWVLQEADDAALKRLLRSEKESREKVDINSWSAALYRALERQSDELILWLNTNV